MRIMDVLTDPWAIVPAKYVEVCEVYNTHLRGEKIDLKALEARLGRPLGNQRKPDVVNGKAIIPVDGVISKRMSLFHDISGGTSTELLQDQILAAVADPAVKEIILAIDSPGGSVDGVKTLSDAIFAARDKKCITAWVDGMGASAAYWIASACSRIFIKDATTLTGSIGVVTAHRDVSKAEEAMGVKTTEITAGKYKRIDSSYAPLTEDGYAYIKDRVDSIYTVFVNDVARNRGVAVDTVLTDMADGRVFVGTDACANGLVDGVATIEDVLNMAPERNAAKLAAIDTPKVEASDTTLEEQMEGIPQEQFDAAVAEATASGEAKVQAERERIQGVLALSAPGHEDLIKTLAFDGITTPDQAAGRILAAEAATRAEAVTNMENGSPAPIKGSADSPEDVEVNEGEAKLKARWDGNSALRALYNDNFDAFVKADALRQSMTASGSVRVFTKNTSK